MRSGETGIGIPPDAGAALAMFQDFNISGNIIWSAIDDGHGGHFPSILRNIKPSVKPRNISMF